MLLSLSDTALIRVLVVACTAVVVVVESQCQPTVGRCARTNTDTNTSSSSSTSKIRYVQKTLRVHVVYTSSTLYATEQIYHKHVHALCMLSPSLAVDGTGRV